MRGTEIQHGSCSPRRGEDETEEEEEGKEEQEEEDDEETGAMSGLTLEDFLGGLSFEEFLREHWGSKVRSIRVKVSTFLLARSARHRC